MELMIIDENPISYETKKIIEILGKNNVGVYSNTSLETLEEYQKYYKRLYTSCPQNLLKFKVKIPYFYNIYGEYSTYADFSYFYSQLMGASGVFISDKKLNKFAEWMNLNSLWVYPQIPVEIYPYTFRKFLTPVLNIGIIQKEKTSNIIQNMWLTKKNNWNLHILGKIKDIPDAEYYLDEFSFYENIQVYIDLDNNPSTNMLKAMSKGIAVIAYNPSKNFDYILFDKVHYFEIDFLDSNTVLEILKYADKRREKLERLSKIGSYLIHKYFNLNENIKQKLKHMQLCR